MSIFDGMGITIEELDVWVRGKLSSSPEREIFSHQSIVYDVVEPTEGHNVANT